jgi:hypothetical protein
MKKSAGLTDAWNALQERIEVMQDSVSRGHWPAADAAEAAQLFEVLPVSTEEIGICRNRLANAREYLDHGERGASLYELMLLRGVVRQARHRLGW